MKLNSRFITTGIACSLSLAAYAQQHPNVILILTDDQGYGDLSITGNPHVKTPVIDTFARQSIRFNNFYVCPVSAPTRSGLLTGRYSLRTGIRDTYNGGALMATGEVTIAEMLKQADYKTGIFGKWHLGDNFPLRPIDQGFDESVVHLGGGMGQPGDFTTYFRKDSSYFDPVLWHNGKQEKYEGYCSDIFASKAIEFIEKNSSNPFFCYLAFNAPHTPLQVPDKYYRMYKGIDPSKGFTADQRPFPVMTENDKEDARKVYAMVTNIDENIGRLLKKLDDLGLTKNTVVIFMTDNGPQQRRYVAGMHGLKGTVYNGGIRVPFYLRYPGISKSNMDIEITAANVDVLPTIADICNTNLPSDRKIDGMSLLPFITGDKSVSPERPLFFYWSRHYPELYNNMALLKGKYKIVGHTDYNSTVDKFELFDLVKDPYELKNIMFENVSVALTLKTQMDSIFRELIFSENLLKPQFIEVGSLSENPVILNRNDADGERGIWDQEDVYGKWSLRIKEGFYNIRFRFIKPVPSNGRMIVETKSFINQIINKENEITILDMKNVYFPSMTCDFISFYEVGARRIFPFWVEIEKIGNIP